MFIVHESDGQTGLWHIASPAATKGIPIGLCMKLCRETPFPVFETQPNSQTGFWRIIFPAATRDSRSSVKTFPQSFNTAAMSFATRAHIPSTKNVSTRQTSSFYHHARDPFIACDRASGRYCVPVTHSRWRALQDSNGVGLRKFPNVLLSLALPRWRYDFANPAQRSGVGARSLASGSLRGEDARSHTKRAETILSPDYD